MLLQVNDKKTTTVVTVMMFEYEADTNKIKIWDMCDNVAIVTTKTPYDASSCVRSLFSNERASLNDADINWDNTEE